MQRKSKIGIRLLAVFTACVLLTTLLSGCAEHTESNSSSAETTQRQTESTQITITKIAEAITTSLQKQETEPTIQADSLAFRVEDYAGDMDAFVYGLLISEYELCYNVFQASIELPDGTSVYGIAYTDYANYYESDDGTGFFPAGFISLIGEPVIPQDAIKAGLEITGLELEDSPSGSSYVYAYECEPFMEHCVVWGQYLQYGVDANGSITYKTENYQRGQCDESLGTLYSYDDEKTVFDPDVGNYIPISGISLSEQIDYTALEAEVNRILDEQDFNFSTADIETTVHFAQEAVNSYLLSLQIESFMGIPVDELIQKASALDPMMCIRITPDGTVEVPLNGEIPQTPDELSKWMVGVSCGIAIASSIAVGIFVPAATPLTGAVTSAAIDVFMQVVVENHALSGVNWAKVAVSATSGALLAWACPLAASGAAGTVGKLLGESAGKFAGYATLTLGNAVVSGATSAAMGIIDGNSSEEIMDAFLIGAAIGGASTIAVTVASKVLSEGAKAANKLISNTKPGKWLADAGAKATAFIGKHQVHLDNHQQLENILHPKSIEEAAKAGANVAKANAKLLNDSIDQLPKDDNLNVNKVDKKGNILSKNDLKENGGKCSIQLSDNCDPDLKKDFADHNVSKLKVTKGQTDMKPLSDYTMNPRDGISSNRNQNMWNYKIQYADEWSAMPNTAPEKVKALFTEEQLKNLGSLSDTNKVKEVSEMLKLANLTPHEQIINNTEEVCLINQKTHQLISHSGGVAVAKCYEAINVCKNQLTELSKISVTRISGSFVA